MSVAGAKATSSVLRVEHVRIKRGERVILDDVSMSAGGGEVVGVVGKNGSGKSTLLMAIAGVLAPSDGRITIAGASVWGTTGERTRARRALGYCPEAADAPGFLRASELWALCEASRGASALTPELIDALGLEEIKDLALERMSLGQRRRACLAAALIGPPQLLVLDEPDNGLDTRRLEALTSLVRAHAAAGHAAIVATHDAALLEALGARIESLA